jgi:hypothetical protein
MYGPHDAYKIIRDIVVFFSGVQDEFQRMVAFSAAEIGLGSILYEIFD